VWRLIFIQREPNTVSTQAQPALKTVADSMDEKQSMFVIEGRSVLLTFCLVSSLFLLWGFCNGMIDVMDKHFQKELGLSLSQSAWVQFAHWMGYFLMSMPAGWLVTRLGYRGGIIAGLLMVAVGGFWFIPAAHIKEFWAFLLGVCVVASGLTFLETVANPYTTVLGSPRYAAARINLAQSGNGIGWVFGPIAGAQFFYATDAAGRSTGSQTLWIPYAGVAVAVLVLAIVFFFAPMPDIRAKDDYSIDEKDDAGGPTAAPAIRQVNRPLSYVLLLGNVCALFGFFGMILWLVLGSLGLGPRLVGFVSSLPHPSSLVITADTALLLMLVASGGLAIVIAAVWLVGVTKRLSHHSIWSHEHFSGAVLAQFFYVAAQAGIFSFLINYMTSEPPSLPASWLKEDSKLVEFRTAFAGSDFKDMSSLAAKLSAPADPLSAFLATKLSASTRQTLVEYRKGTVGETAARVAVMQDLNSLILEDSLYSPERFNGVALRDNTKQLLAQDAKGRNERRLNRLLLADAYSKELAYHDGVVGITDQFASYLVSFGFICFFLGRITGAALMRRASAHRIVGLYAVVNVVACLLVFCKLGWLSVVCVFLSYFFMSIMFPTIFALGIFGLGNKAKGASAYIVMAIVGGALLPKLMGAVADHYDMSRGFIVPLLCFVLIALYGYTWPKLSRAESLQGVGTSGGH
jgi:fucose permease